MTSSEQSWSAISVVVSLCLALFSPACFGLTAPRSEEPEEQQPVPARKGVPPDVADQATVAAEVGGALVGRVPASNYTLDFRAFTLTKDVNNVVLSESGYAQLVAAGVLGQDYAIYEGALTNTSLLVEIEAAYDDAATRGLLSALTALQLPATGFGLSMVDLDTRTERTVIIRNTNDGVSSYQLLLVTFS